jgi:hypothetical protein
MTRRKQEGPLEGAFLLAHPCCTFTLTSRCTIAPALTALRIAVNSNWDSFAPISVLIEAMVARLSAQRWPEVKTRTEELESIRRKLDTR